jgi:hypothetical protein
VQALLKLAIIVVCAVVLAGQGAVAAIAPCGDDFGRASIQELAHAPAPASLHGRDANRDLLHPATDGNASPDLLAGFCCQTGGATLGLAPAAPSSAIERASVPLRRPQPEDVSRAGLVVSPRHGPPKLSA